MTKTRSTKRVTTKNVKTKIAVILGSYWSGVSVAYSIGLMYNMICYGGSESVKTALIRYVADSVFEGLLSVYLK